MHVFLLTGEPSGDLHGARLAQALYAQEPGVRISGVGGTRMRQAGVHLVAESEHWGAIGIPEALQRVPALLWQMRRLTRVLRTEPPDVLVPIDFGAFNVRLLRRLAGSGIPTVYYIPPGCWSRHRAPGRLPFLVDAIATPFPWSAENLRRAGAPARIEWVGHPLLDYVQTTGTREEARRRLGVDAEQPVVALVPGSRRTEVSLLLPVFLQAMRHLPAAPVCLLSIAPSLAGGNLPALAAQQADASGIRLQCIEGLDYDLLQAADAALVASGTATLELACLGLPMVVAYRGSALTYLQYRLVARGGRLRHIALPNILADADLVPELLQDAANPQALAGALAPLLGDSQARNAQLAGFQAIRRLLGDGHACTRTATLIRDVAVRALAPTPRAPF